MITTGRKKNGMERWNAVWKNISITAGILAAASGFTLLLNSFVDSDSHVPLLFVLAICLFPVLRKDIFTESWQRLQRSLR